MKNIILIIISIVLVSLLFYSFATEARFLPDQLYYFFRIEKIIFFTVLFVLLPFYSFVYKIFGYKCWAEMSCNSDVPDFPIWVSISLIFIVLVLVVRFFLAFVYSSLGKIKN